MPPRNRDDFARYTKNGTVKVIIGNADPPTKNQIFHIYRDLLIAVSPYFRTKLNPDEHPNGLGNGNNRAPSNANATANANAMFVDQVLEDDNPASLREPNLPLAPFTQFVNWLYNKPLSQLVRDHALTTDTYLLAHTLESEAFRNDIVDAVRAHHARNPDDQLGLRSMVHLAKQMCPDDKNNEGRVRLLEFLVAQMTYKVIVRGWEGGGFCGNGLVKRLFATSTTVVMWHLDALHEMLISQGFVGAVQALDRGRVKMEDVEDEEMNGGGAGGGKSVPKVKRPALSLPPNPAEFVGCAWHEHKFKESRCGNATLID